MKQRFLARLLPLIFLASCSSEGILPPVNAVIAFRNEKVELTANSDRAVSDRPVTFKIRCYPQVTGVGRMYLNGWSADARSLLFIEAPRRDTLDTINRRFEYVMMFTAGVPSELEVVVRMQPDMDYFYSADAFLDSVFIPDSAKMFHVLSDAAVAFSGRSGGYISQASYQRTLPLYWKP